MYKPKTVSKTRQYVSLVQFLVEKEKRLKITRAAFELGVSLKHFRYYILPMILDVAGCIEYDKKAEELVFTCEPEVAARKEAEEYLKRVGIDA